ncbi:MAG: CinA-like protein [Acidimicrobiales bacterium]|nr:MAG: CinA-like protein [Acidimicrobiales bacterium]
MRAKCEVVTVGDELLLGQIVDTNSAWLAERLATLGIECARMSTVGDDIDAIAEAISTAASRCEVVLVCGGLGPTPDDVTRDAVARVLGVELRRRPELVERIERLFASRGYRMPSNNERQADIPDGAELIPVMPGTAAGFFSRVDGAVVYVLPGVPHELREMFDAFVGPDIVSRFDVESVIEWRTLRTWGETESGLAERLSGFGEEPTGRVGVSLAFLPSSGEGIRLRVTARGDDKGEVRRVLEESVSRLKERLGDLVFSEDDRSMAAVVVDMLKDRGESVGVAESFTGGMVAEALTSVPGASSVFRGGVVAYDPEVKFSLLGVRRGPVVCEEAAEDMAEGVRDLMGVTWALATTGVAGPDSSEGHPPGTAYLAVAGPDETRVACVRFPGDRERVRRFATITALDLLRRRLSSLGR